MRTPLVITTLLGISGLAWVSSSPAEPIDWQLVWSDEFDGKQLDYGKWGVAYDALGGGNQELQFYTDRPKNVRVEGGHLVLEAHAEKYSGMGTPRDYTSGRVRTKHRGDWTYGRVEVRAKLPEGRGIWPAIWMLPTDERYGGWARSGEIDIMENVGHEPSVVHGTIHFGDAWPKNQSSGGRFELEQGTFADDFHVFAIEWQRDEIRWFVDGERYHTEKQWRSAKAPFPAPFDQRFHLLLNLAVGGRWPGNPDASTAFPQRLEVDYVRVYERR
ncbi:MAG: glycoside hydrolase family 16 protein [Planctomycetes bacterium]|nr:glycoside hydrolase family 16 protein [Planctomycetota bacterium]